MQFLSECPQRIAPLLRSDRSTRKLKRGLQPKLTKLFLLHMFSKHGVLAHVTSNQGTEFVSHFFWSLRKALNMHLHFTSSYHPEGDGQTKCTNQTLEQYLWSYCNYQQDNWSELLPLAEFMYNNAPSATTRVSPFFTNKGYHPNIFVYPECNMTSARPMNMQLTQTHCINTFVKRWPMHNFTTKVQLMPKDLWLWISRSATKCM